jgi:hypothetical protein
MKTSLLVAAVILFLGSGNQVLAQSAVTEIPSSALCVAKKSSIQCHVDSISSEMTCGRYLIVQNAEGLPQLVYISTFDLGHTHDAGGVFFYESYKKSSMKWQLDFKSAVLPKCR